MLCLPLSFGKGEIVAAVHCRENLSPFFTGRCQHMYAVRRGRARDNAATVSRERRALSSGPEFQALKSGSNVDADLTLQADRLQGNGIVGAADQHIATG